MTRALALSKREAKSLLQAAEEQRGIIEVKIGDKVFRLIPECHAPKIQPIDDDVDMRF